MADDVTLKDGANADFIAAADEIGGKKFQRVKVTFGADGTATDVSTAAPIPAVDAAVKAVLDTIKTQNDTALTHLSASDTQMANLIDAVTSNISLATGSSTIGNVGLVVGATPVADSNRMPVKTAVGATPTDRSVAITAGGVAQTIAAAKTDRTFLLVQNQDPAVDLYVRVTGTASAAQTSLLLGPKQGYEWPSACVPIGAVSVFSSKTGHLVHCEEL